ncbi:protein OXIDATIVE STRESS 3-like [Corylus avellana]|uniref:protein OXIDATIVE STRESS 3-like n=1 Tax=Corylus avellana TaxID=13451 RepID=UPI00286C8585|nr:protein OXIDATIVE STRESS 3-like [Corylus avellana]
MYVYMLPQQNQLPLFSSSSSSSSMGDQQVNSTCANGGWHEENWVVMEGGEDNCDSISIGSSTNSINSAASSSSSLELVEDATSSTSSYSSSSSAASASASGPLFELSELMIHLPIKRGLSRYYEGKSQSFTSLASVKSLEDLLKKTQTPQHRKKMKACKSYAGGLDHGHKSSTLPKATISKKGLRRGSSLSSVGRRGGLLAASRPSFPVK